MEHTVLQLLENANRRAGKQIALLDDKYQLTYEELREKALIIANFIASWDVTKRAVVVLAERDIRCVALFWGVLYSGNFYVPLNYKENKGILCELLKKIHPTGILCCYENREIEELCIGLKIEYGCFDKIIHDQTRLDWHKIHILESDPAYMVFTSGSTGVPKGVIKSHHSVMSFIKSFLDTFSFQQEDVFGNQAEFDYDVAAKDIYLTAAVTAKLVIIPRKCFLMPVKLMQYLQEQKINTLIWAAAAVRLVAQSGCLEKYYKNLKIKKVFFSGEELRKEEISVWVKSLPTACYVNLYAPSEVTGNCLYYQLDNIHIPLKLPLGIPFQNCEILLLNDNLELAGEHEQGEICVRSPFLAMGYYKDLEQTKEKFIQNPLNDDYIDYIYRTGDLAKYVNGNLYFLGRKDEQIKFMGHRIELFEVESVFLQVSEAKKCCCILADFTLVLFYIGAVDIPKAIGNMKAIVPKYKIPQKFIELKDFPENERGKVDRRKLKEQYKES